MRRTNARVLIIAAVIALPAIFLVVRLIYPIAAWLGMGARIELGNYKEYELSGIVVDEKGSPLDDVRVNIEKSWKRKIGFETDSKTETRTVSKSFNFKIDNCDKVRLSFFKAGYYGSGETFMTGGRREGLRFVLQKQGRISKPAEYSAGLQFSVDGSGTAIDLSLPPEAPRRGPSTHPIARPIVDLSRRDLLPPNGIYMTAQVGTDGKLKTVTQKWPNSTTTYLYPSRILIRAVDPMGGFIRLDLDASDPVRRRTQLFEAPVDGYQQQLVLTPSDFLPPRTTTTPKTHFYFRSGGKYGRGSIGSADVTPDHRTINLGIRLLLQPDGSRNLEFQE